MSSKGRNILIVDDEENIRRMLRATLELEGYSVREAIDALESIESIENELPDVVLLDLWMPGASGMSVLEHLSHRPSEERPSGEADNTGPTACPCWHSIEGAAPKCSSEATLSGISADEPRQCELQRNIGSSSAGHLAQRHSSHRAGSGDLSSKGRQRSNIL